MRYVAGALRAKELGLDRPPIASNISFSQVGRSSNAAFVQLYGCSREAIKGV